MKYTKLRDGLYKAENGMTIKSNAGVNLWTKKVMKPTFWYVYGEEGNQTVYGGETLKEAKDDLERAIEKGEVR